MLMVEILGLNRTVRTPQGVVDPLHGCQQRAVAAVLGLLADLLKLRALLAGLPHTAPLIQGAARLPTLPWLPPSLEHLAGPLGVLPGHRGLAAGAWCVLHSALGIEAAAPLLNESIRPVYSPRVLLLEQLAGDRTILRDIASLSIANLSSSSQTDRLFVRPAAAAAANHVADLAQLSAAAGTLPAVERSLLGCSHYHAVPRNITGSLLWHPATS
jgi:hypothetical protein